MRQLPLPDNRSALALLKEIFSRKPALPSDDNVHSVVLYGGGELGRLALDFLIYVGKKVEFVIDQAASEGDMLSDLIPMYRLDNCPSIDNHLILITTVSVPYSEISENLNKRGLKRVRPFYDYALQFADRHPLNNGWFSGILVSEEQKEIASVLTGLRDVYSQASYLQFLAWRVLREDWVFNDLTVFNGNRFFIDPVIKAIREEENFLDVGSYDGRGFLQFLAISHEKFRSALLIEPDDKNFSLLEQAINKLPDEISHKITLLNGALSSASGRQHFSHGFNFASRLGNISLGEVNVFRLDDLNFPASFIKIHIEGEEYEALNGGLNLIKKYRPILAITVYHNRDGLWKIPKLIMENISDYNFYFRMHSWCGTGAVIYGISRERTDVRMNYS